MAFELDDIALNLTLAEDGVWVDLPGDAQVLVARWNSKRFQQAVRKYAGDRLGAVQAQMRKRKLRNRSKSEKEQAEEQEALEIMCKIMAEGVLLDWRNIERGGEPLPHSFENAVNLLKDPRMEAFREFVEMNSRDEELFYEKQIEEDSGNSQSGSDTNS